jgi:hypothetical protein
MTVKIYKLLRGVEVYRWLCDAHVAKAEAEGWEIKGRRTPPNELRCEDCPREEVRE